MIIEAVGGAGKAIHSGGKSGRALARVQSRRPACMLLAVHFLCLNDFRQ